MLPDLSLLNSPPPAPAAIFAWRDIATDTRGRSRRKEFEDATLMEDCAVDVKGLEAGCRGDA